jgi:RNA polymerase sigma-70 factor, ECF subfamily
MLFLERKSRWWRGCVHMIRAERIFQNDAPLIPDCVTNGFDVTHIIREMDHELDDAELAVRIGRGDGAAEAEMCRRLAPRIRLYGLRHLRDEQAAADLTQQVLITALEALRAGRLREREKLSNFVLGTCRMTILDQRRGAQRRERLLNQYGADLLPPAQLPMPRLDHDRLRSCLQGLKERERSVVVMSFYDEQTGADVAGFLGVSEANVRVIRHRAIHQLRDCMGVAG